MTDIAVVEPKSSIFDPIFNKLPYPIASGLVRGLRAFLGILMPVLIAAIADGSIFSNIHVIPQGYIPLIIALATPFVLGIDKWLREKGLEDAVAKASTSLASTGPAPTDTLADTPTDIPNP